jgi:hypothetical protein
MYCLHIHKHYVCGGGGRKGGLLFSSFAGGGVGWGWGDGGGGGGGGSEEVLMFSCFGSLTMSSYRLTIWRHSQKPDTGWQPRQNRADTKKMDRYSDSDGFQDPCSRRVFFIVTVKNNQTYTSTFPAVPQKIAL